VRHPRLLAVALLVPVAALAQEWTRFRGPNGSGAAGPVEVPLRWAEKDFLWKTPLPGTGNASPVVLGGKVFATAGDDKAGTRHVVCLDAATGKELWKRTSQAKAYKLHKRNAVATATPAVDADRVYVAWGTPAECVVEALDHAGKPVWQADLGPYPSQHGFGASPVLVGDAVVLLRQPDGPGDLVALDRATGAARWKLPRQGKNATYATPCLFERPGRPAELVTTNWQHGVSGVDPATGKLLWELPVFDRTTAERAIGSPVVAGDLVLGVCGFITGVKHLVAVRPADPATGEMAKEVWRLEKGVPQMATPLVVGSRVYLLTEAGQATCVDARDGKVLWQERLPIAAAGSPVLAGDRIYCAGAEGEVVVLGTGEKFEILAENRLGEATQATPAVAGGRLFFRTAGHVVAVGAKR